MVEKCFGQILTTFPGSGTTIAAKFENQIGMTRYCNPIIPTRFAVQFLLITISATEKIFGGILVTNQSRPGEDKVENRA